MYFLIVSAQDSANAKRDLSRGISDSISNSDAVPSGTVTVNSCPEQIGAVYVDKAEAERRASSFIISGLPSTNSSSDRDLVSHLCLNEFGICPEIAFAKRLGRPVPDKVQPLLVYDAL